MKTLLLLIALIAITKLELQATNPCLCEYFQYRRIMGDSTEGSNVDLQQIDTCKSSPNFNKIFANKAQIIFKKVNPFYSSTFNAEQAITENDIDSVNFSFTKSTVQQFLTFFGSATITADSFYRNFNSKNELRFHINFSDYVKVDDLDTLGKYLDTVSSTQKKFFLGFNEIKLLLSIYSENEEISYYLNNQSINFNKIFNEVIIIDILGRSTSFKLTDKIDLQEMNEKFYFIIARKGDKYFKTKIILE